MGADELFTDLHDNQNTLLREPEEGNTGPIRFAGLKFQRENRVRFIYLGSLLL
mgnify:CR=1 FL=1